MGYFLGRTEYISCFMSEKNPKGTRERGKKTQNEKKNTNFYLTKKKKTFILTGKCGFNYVSQ